MAKRFLTSIDITKNEIQNVVIHNLATAPSTPKPGQIYYNTTDQRWYLRTSTTWLDVSGSINDILSTTNAVNIVDNADGTFSIDISNATTGVDGLMSSADKTKLNNATASSTPSTLVERDANGDVAVDDLSAVNVIISGPPSIPTHAATKGYVDALVSAGLTIKGAIDASTNPNYPAAIVGDAYHISVAGLIGGGSGEPVEIGDMIVAIAASVGGTDAAVGADWIVMQSNVDQATETVAGLLRIATTAEVDAGVNDDTAVTPAKMVAYVSGLTSTSKFSVDVGNGVATVINITHSLGTLDVGVTVVDISSGDSVETDIKRVDVNTVRVTFAVAPTTNQYRVIIQG